jgi:acetyltransferase-like isoleucine patch superfamily enzyme
LRYLIRTIVRHFALTKGWWPSAYLRVCRPDSIEYAEYLKRHGGFHSIGENCHILPTTNFTDPAYVRIGNNVHFSNCAVIGHDGSIAMLNRAYGVKLEAVGKIDIQDNVFVGYHAIILPGVTIGPDAIVAAGSVVTKDVAPGDIVAGVPARPIGKVRDLVDRLEAQTKELPWAELIRQRMQGFDPLMEPELVKRRVAHFFPEDRPR